MNYDLINNQLFITGIITGLDIFFRLLKYAIEKKGQGDNRDICQSQWLATQNIP